MKGTPHKAKEELLEMSENVDPFVCDVTSEKDKAELAAFAIDRFSAINLIKVSR